MFGNLEQIIPQPDEAFSTLNHGYFNNWDLKVNDIEKWLQYSVQSL
jgi:hypothetical protein